MKRIHYATLTLKITIPVYSHTVEEAKEIAKDQLPDFVSHYDADEWELARWCSPEVSSTKPPHVANDTLVWGDGVPEDHCTVETLTQHLAKKR